jgi:hypothetical protein
LHKKSDGTTVVLRHVFDKIVSWINKFKGIGDILGQFDPVHASLPWAAIRFFLQVEQSPFIPDAMDVNQTVPGLR